MKYIKYLLTFLSVSFSGFLLYVFDKIWGDKIHWSNYSNINFNNFLFAETNVKVLYILIFLILIYPSYRLVKKISDKYNLQKIDKVHLRRIETSKFKSYNSPEDNLLFRWNVYYDYASNPKIENLTPYCTCHGNPPIKLVNNAPYSAVKKFTCTMYRCGTMITENGLKNFENYFESMLIDIYHRN